MRLPPEVFRLFMLTIFAVGVLPSLAFGQQRDSIFNDHVVFVQAMNPRDTLMGRPPVPAVYVGSEREARRGSFIVSCNIGSPSISVRDADPATDLGGLFDMISVRWRFDDGSVQRGKWLVAASGQRVYVAPTAELSEFLDRAGQASRMVVEISLPNLDRYTYLFDLAGYRDAVLYGLKCIDLR